MLRCNFYADQDSARVQSQSFKQIDCHQDMFIEKVPQAEQTHVSIRSENLIALIDAEYSLVLDGKSSDHLCDLLHDYQLNPFTAHINKNSPLLDKYPFALLMNGRYVDLAIFLRRYKDKDILHRQHFTAIAEAGQREQFKPLGYETTKFINSLGPREEKLKNRLRSATARNLLTLLSKYFVNVELKDVTNCFDVREEDIIEGHHSLKEGFVYLKQEETVSTDCLQSKLKELAVVSNKMTRFE